MKARGVTQDEVARLAGVDRTMVNKVVNGRAVSQKVLDAIVALLAVPRPPAAEAYRQLTERSA
jgi:transcriptional regulator with XRE-family HTH domain